MTEKVLPQLVQTLRASPLTDQGRLELALTALALAQLSVRNQVPSHLQLTPTLAADPDRLARVLAELSSMGGLRGQAFAGAANYDLSSTSVREAFELALQVAATGVLDRFDPSDAVTFLTGKGSGAWSLPPEVASLLEGLAEIRPNDTVYTAWDWGAQLAMRAATAGARVCLESPINSPIPALVSVIADEDIEIRFGDPIRSPSFLLEGRPQVFDVAIAFPPMGQRYTAEVLDRDWFKRFPERTHSGSVLAVRHLLAQAKRRVVVAVPNNLTFSPGAESSLREDLVSKGMIHSVIAMPAGLLESSSLAFTILVLDPAGGLEDVQFINADDPDFLKRTSKARSNLVKGDYLVELSNERAATRSSVCVPEDHVMGPGALLEASNYLLSASAEKLEFKLAGLPRIELGAVVTTVRPMPVSKHDEGIEVGEIGAADIPAHGYIQRPGRTVRVEATEKNQHNFLRPYDIVLIVKGSVGKVGIVPAGVPASGSGGWVAGQSAIVLRVVSDRIDPRALALQLRSDLGQELLRQLVRGATIPLIRISELMTLEVLVPDRNTTDAAAAALEKEGELQQQIEVLKMRLDETTADLWSVA